MVREGERESTFNLEGLSCWLVRDGFGLFGFVLGKFTNLGASSQRWVLSNQRWVGLVEESSTIFPFFSSGEDD
jgi:hypothetical protein